MSDVTTRVLTAHVPIALAQRLDQVAARLDRSRGWIIRQALVAWIEQEEEIRLVREVPKAVRAKKAGSKQKR
jgi:predicted transcriptional regulator